ncbi:hypothetical protein phytr_10620 [Candidatus Phycorickettsia trachydisci]|uniref:Uncharacterized protein n=1 Tax=Candidatus Phycorickettsia trachydisci TaxID=2115978 RepID=A0A2P1P9Q1_9RICK|nr:ankyrin repeat domain-containing protein [Candidatus Phycorickettsia trachydisci]AVP87990.1 hypothetical protein phytr_10620 [Candidatus Phycorickettsia trachydisci]
MPEETKNSIVSDVGQDNTALLHQAIRKGDYIKIKELLQERKIDIDAEDAFGMRPLYKAVLKNYVNIAKILLEQGADPNATSDGSVALEMAARQGNMEMLMLLLDGGATVNTKNCLLLHAAAGSIKDQELEAKKNDGWKVMRYLIQNYPLNPYEKDDRGLTPQDILGEIDWSFEDYYSELVNEWRAVKETSLLGES